MCGVLIEIDRLLHAVAQVINVLLGGFGRNTELRGDRRRGECCFAPQRVVDIVQPFEHAARKPAFRLFVGHGVRMQELKAEGPELVEGLRVEGKILATSVAAVVIS